MTAEIEHFIKHVLPLKMVMYEPYSEAELSLFAKAVLETQPDFIFEWGTYLGVSAKIFWEIKSHFNLSAEIHTVDLLPDGSWRADVLEKDNMARYSKDISGITHHFGDGVETSLALCELFGAKNPLFFCDGDHEFTTVKRELEAIYAAYPNAKVLVHDTGATTSDHGNNGPFLAVMETKESKNLNMISVETGPGLTFLNGVNNG